MARHPVLRTSFHLSEFEQPLQLVHQQVTPQLSVDDLQGLSTDEQEEAIATWIEQEKQNPFNFQKAPLIRFHLHQRSENSFNLTLTKHHAILDGWSVAILMTELCQQYLLLLDESFAQNVSPLSPAPSFTLCDFIAQEQALLGNKTAQQYWRHTLADLTVTQLPRWPDRDTNHTPAAIGVQPIELAPSLTQALKELARTAGVPLKTVLLTAHLRVISWLSNQTDVTTGLVSNGRPAIAGSDRVMGLFFNTMPLRLQLTRGSWLELVRQTFAAEREALPFQSYPLAELQQTIVDGQPLFETVFNYINFHEFQRLSGLDALELISGQFFERSHFALVAQASVNLVTHELEFHLRYDLSEFTAEQISAMAQYYQAVLNAMSSQPNASYEKVCLLTSAERRRLLVEWNDTQTEYPHDQCIHQLVETQVERTPDAIAALFEDERLSYRELNARANQVAHYLQSLGVGPEVLVGICVERSIEMLVGLLGILKAGGAYVPLDPGFPQQRLQFMLADAQISVLLTQERLLAALPELKAQVVSLDRDWSAIAQASPKNLDSDVTAENLAYVIYTSGSTGTPKGVQVQHQSVVNFLTSMQVSPGLQSTDRLAAVTTLSFDIAALELYLPLITGAAVAIMPLAVTKDGHQLKAQLNSTQATVMQATPATWQMLLDAGWSSASTPMTLLCGGEALSYELSCQLLASGQKLWNLYGPTETTIWSTRFCAERSSSKKEQYSKQPIAIGRPIANTQLYILDSYLQPVPIGVAGELHIGGAGLARGYLNRPELTAGKFIVSPFVEGESQQSEASSQQSSSSSPSPLPASSRPRVSASLPGAHLYKTGDLARYLPDGNIEFLGRIDHQAKIRGFRIELGEIEAALAQHPAVQQSVAIVREDVFDGKRLIAYIIPTQNQALTIDELRRFLKQQLPKYMMPEVFMLLDSLPLTPNGKVDRRALPAPDLSRSDLSNPFVAPRTVVEQQLADIWAEVLNIEKVGIHDNFFDLGGHSLLATQVASRVRQVFSTEFPLATLFESPTLAELSEFIEMLRWVGSSQDCSDDNTDDYLEEAI